MKFKFSIYTLMCLSISMIHAEWDTITLKEHIDKSSIIVIAKFEQEVEKKEGRFGDISQLVSFEANETIKGKLLGRFFVKGQSIEACMPQMLFPNTPKTKYLLFLEQERNTTTYNLVHGERSALVVENNGSIGWIQNREKIDMGESVSVELSRVKEEIIELKERD